MKIINEYSTDWLGSTPVFYNEKTKKVSGNINNVIDLKNLEFHPEGLNNYLDFGYSVFEQTPIKNVKFLKHSSKIISYEDGSLKIESSVDPAEKLLDNKISEDDVWAKLENLIQTWEKTTNDEIIIPTSGGYDSRILNFFIADKSRIRSFTYGVSENQSKSYEVLYAKKLSEILNTKWEQITLGDFNNYFGEWDEIYGASTHAHGMYHLEFYKKILEKISGGNPLLSGIIGDAWSGGVKIDEISSPDQIYKLGYSHGLNSDSKQSLLKSDTQLKEEYFEKNKLLLKNFKWRIIEAMRHKIILLSYLKKIPQYFGLKPWSPFLDIDIAISMLNLPEKRRENRLWQKDFFKKNNLYVEEKIFLANKDNTLNLRGIRNFKFSPLDADLLKEIIKKDYVERINKRIMSASKSLYLKKMLYNIFYPFSFFPEINSFLKFPVIHNYHLGNEENKAYSAYLTLKPIENLLIRRSNL